MSPRIGSALRSQTIRLGNRSRENFDVVVIAGDHLDISSAVEAQVQIAVILTYLKRLHAKTKLIVCSGNHDLDTLNAAGEKLTKWITKVRQFGVPTDGDSLSVDGVLITICPWWDGPQMTESRRRSIGARCHKAEGAMDLGLSCAARRVADELGRTEAFR